MNLCMREDKAFLSGWVMVTLVHLLHYICHQWHHKQHPDKLCFRKNPMLQMESVSSVECMRLQSICQHYVLLV